MKELTVGSFNSLDVRGNMKVSLRQESGSGVTIQTDDNLFEFLDVRVEGNTLVVDTRDGYNLNPSKDIIAYVSAPDFREIQLSGACDIVSEGIISGNEKLIISGSGSSEIELDVNVPAIETSLSGSGSVKLTGEARHFIANVSGSGDIICFDLVADNIQLDLSGSADVEVTANKQLDIDASGSSNVSYRGNAKVTQSISGSGSVKKVD